MELCQSSRIFQTRKLKLREATPCIQNPQWPSAGLTPCPHSKPGCPVCGSFFIRRKDRLVSAPEASGPIHTPVQLLLPPLKAQLTMTRVLSISKGSQLDQWGPSGRGPLQAGHAVLDPMSPGMLLTGRPDRESLSATWVPVGRPVP